MTPCTDCHPESQVNRIAGIVPPLLTPLIDDDCLDIDGLHLQLDRFIRAGIHGIFLLGSCGEGPSLSYRIRRELIHEVASHLQGRMPILAGVSDTSFVELMRMADYAAQEGVTAVVLAGPYYYPLASDDFLRYLEAVAEQLPIPAFLYNMPSHTKLWFQPSLLKRVLTHPKYIGVKDSSGDMNYFTQVATLMRNFPDKSLFIGSDFLLPQGLEVGCDGGICGGANLFPTLFVGLYNAFRRNDASRLALLKKQLDSLKQLYTCFEGASFLSTTKTALSLLGICSDHFAEPFHSLKAQEKQKVHMILERIQTESISGMM